MSSTFICEFCGSEFHNIQGVRGHIKSCSKRILNRYFKCGHFLYVFTGNPIKRNVFGINTLAKDKLYYENPQKLYTAFKLLEAQHQLQRFYYLDCSKSSRFCALDNGLVRKSFIVNGVLVKEDMDILLKNVDIHLGERNRPITK
jgi:hypothetical protein